MFEYRSQVLAWAQFSGYNLGAESFIDENDSIASGDLLSSGILQDQRSHSAKAKGGRWRYRGDVDFTQCQGGVIKVLIGEQPELQADQCPRYTGDISSPRPRSTGFPKPGSPSVPFR